MPLWLLVPSTRGAGVLQGEKAGELSPAEEEITAPGSVHCKAVRGKSFTEQSPAGQQARRPQRLHNELQCWPRFQWAVKEISLILPEETEHSAEALTTDRLSHPVDYALGGVRQEVGSPLTLGDEGGGRLLRREKHPFCPGIRD